MNWIKKHIIKLILFLTISTAAISTAFVEDYYFEVSKNLDIFATLFRNVNSCYVDSIQPGYLMRVGIDAMLAKLDPYTVYVPESEIEDYRMTHISAEYGGIGALVHKRGEFIEISDLYEGFPAQKAGVKVGDKILSVNGSSTKGKSVDQVSDYMRGQKGTEVNLLLERIGASSPVAIKVIRDEIKFKNVPYYGMVNEQTGYIKLTQFLDDASEQVREALIELKKNNAMQNVILDLRGNGGGLLKEAVEIVNLFVDKGQKVVFQKGKLKEFNAEYYASKQAVDTTIKVVVLVDRGSASASEIVTGAIQELDRGVVIGQRTFGKGLVQQTYNLSYNTLLKVTIAKYYTPSGRCIQAIDYTKRASANAAAAFNDSLSVEFKTKHGRSVYDGNGIFPDLYVESKPFSNITKALAKNYLFFDFANQFVLTHQSITPAKEFSLTDSEFKEFEKFLSDKIYDYENRTERVLADLQKAAEKDQVLADIKSDFDLLKQKIATSKKRDLATNRTEIKEVLENEIASRYYYQNGRLESRFKYDKEIKEAINTFNNQQLYDDILSGKGIYGAIGKPGSSVHTLAGSVEMQGGEEEDHW